MSEKPKSPSVDEGLRLGQMALERQWITPDQLREALALQSRILTEQHRRRPLGNILVEQGFLNSGQLVTLLDLQRERSLPPPFGKYTILRELGRGGMGVVYEALDTELGRKVALKLMLGNALAGPQENRLEEERFLREARLTANLVKHPALVSVYEVGIIDGKRYFAMELIDGSSYAKWRKSGSITIRQQVKVLRDVAVGIHHAHQQGTIHRDLKPDNILVDKEGHPHVTDFGLAKSVGQNVHLSLTASGMIMGTPAYMSPEQAMGEKGIDQRTDVYALGVLLFETLTGRPPFTGETPIEILMKASKDPVPLPSSVVKAGSNPTLDQAIENICLKALAKRPQDRYPSAEALAADLTRWLGGEEVLVRPPQQTRRKVVPPPRKSSWIPLSVGGALAIGAVAIGVTVIGSSPTPSATPAPQALVRSERERAQREADKLEIERLKRERDQALKDAQGARQRAEKERADVERAKTDLELRQAAARLKEPAAPAVASPEPDPSSPIDWFSSTSGLPPEDQVRRVIEKLREKNPGFDGREMHEVQDGAVTAFKISALGLADLSPVRAFPKLTNLTCSGSYNEETQELKMGDLASLEPLRGMKLEGLAVTRTRVSDLSPLVGMRLTKIDVGFTRVSDLSPLRGMPLEVLECWSTPVRDLSPVSFKSMVWLNIHKSRVSDLAPAAGAPLVGLRTQGAPLAATTPIATMTDLRDLSLDFDARRDTSLLKSLKSLEKINGVPAADFLKKEGTPAAATDLKAGLVGHWKLTEGSGSAPLDALGGRLKAKASAGTQWTRGKTGWFLHFDGQNSSVELPNSPSLDRLQANSYSVSAWFKPDRLPASSDPNLDRYMIVSKRGWSEGLIYNDKGQFCMDHWLLGDENAMAGTWEDSYPPGRFYLVTGVVDLRGSRTQIYVDDRLVDTRPWGEAKETRAFGSEPWRVGINAPGADSYRWPALGMISDVRLYARALSATDVGAIFKAEAALHDR